MLALRACAEEDKEGWLSLLQDMRTRGATQLDLIVTDGHDGLLAAVSKLFSATPRQRCLVHKQRNVLNAIPRREREAVQGELTGIWKQEKKEDALANLVTFKAKYAQRYPEAVRSLFEDEDHLLTFYAFPPTMYRHIQTTNAIEGFSIGFKITCLILHSGSPLEAHARKCYDREWENTREKVWILSFGL